MHILVVTAVYPPEPIVSARTSQDIAQEAMARNAEVTVIAPFPNRPEGVLHKEYRGSSLWKIRIEYGVRVIRLRALISRTGSLLSRTLENVSFGVIAALVLVFVRRPDVVYLNTWPVIATGLSVLVAKARGLPYVISVQDVYPESLVVQDRIEADRWLHRFLRRIDNWVCDNAADRILLSEGMREIYSARGAEWAKEAKIVPNWIDVRKTEQVDKSSRERFRMEIGVPLEATLIVFGGNIGTASGLSSVIESFEEFKEYEGLYLLIAGSGSELKRCRDLAVRSGNPRILFYSPWPQRETGVVLGAADFLLLPTVGDQSMVSVPSKLLSYMAVGRPVLAFARKESEISRVIVESGCGLVAEPGNSGQFFEAILEMRAWSHLVRDTKGRAGRTYVLENFEREICVPRILSLLKQTSI